MAMTTEEQVQFYLGDTVVGQGPRPDGRNYSVDEIAEFLTQGGNLNGAVVLGYTQLAGEWRSFGVRLREGDVDYSAITTSDRFLAQAKYYQANPIPLVGQGLPPIPLHRLDAYSTPPL